MTISLFFAQYFTRHKMLGGFVAAMMIGFMGSHAALAALPADYEPEPVSESQIWVTGSYQGYKCQNGCKDPKLKSSYSVMSANFGYQHMTEFFGDPLRLVISAPFVNISARSSYYAGRATHGMGDLTLDAVLWLISEPELDNNLAVRLSLKPATGDSRESLNAKPGTGTFSATAEIGYRYGIMDVDTPILSLVPILSATYYASQNSYYMGPRYQITPVIEPQFYLSAKPFNSMPTLEFHGGIGMVIGGDAKYENNDKAKGSREIYLGLGAGGELIKEMVTLSGEARIILGQEKTTPYSQGSLFSLQTGYKF